ncbi:hypothetical protein EDB92DRAFT_1818287 [Lactarius akahatsu]|uniref:Uncharacterized protein n=1 Tax=Lactarius akahatsu TaxID=416441 RepID=A0AAD4LB88_9AGAM|nr:hypothetical protein EDB92DRAFT_1818287 [Lactarius akahatsu]
MQKKQKQEKVDEGQQCSPPKTLGSNRPIEYIYIESDMESSEENVPIQFEDKNVAMKKLKKIFKSTDQVFFHRGYDIPADPLISDRAQVQVTAHEIWKATGYRFM